jgi:hypothetical protein
VFIPIKQPNAALFLDSNSAQAKSKERKLILEEYVKGIRSTLGITHSLQISNHEFAN